MVPILGAHSFYAIGLPNASSQARPWTGLDLNENPDFKTIIATRSDQHKKFGEFISETQIEDLPESVSIEKNGNVSALMSIHVVLEEEFEHLPFMIRDFTVE